MDYKKYNDNELIYMVQENDENSVSILLNKYKPILLKISNEYYRKYNGNIYEFDDFYQESLIAFYKALHMYDDNRNALFYTYVVMCVRRALSSFGRIVFNSRNTTDNIDISELEYSIEDINENPKVRDSFNGLESIIRDVLVSLSLESSSILELRINGFTYKEISILLNIPISSVEYKSRGARNMLRNRVRVYYCK